MKKFLFVFLFLPNLFFAFSFLGVEGAYDTRSPRQNGFLRLSYESVQQNGVGDVSVLVNADLPVQNWQPYGSYSFLAHFDFLSLLDIHPFLVPVFGFQALTDDATQSPSLNLGAGVLFRSEDEEGLKYFALDVAFLYHSPLTNGFSANVIGNGAFKPAKVLLFDWRFVSHLSMFNERLDWDSSLRLLYDLDSIKKANPMNLDLSDEATLIGVEGTFNLLRLSSVMSYNGGGALIVGWKF